MTLSGVNANFPALRSQILGAVTWELPITPVTTYPEGISEALVIHFAWALVAKKRKHKSKNRKRMIITDLVRCQQMFLPVSSMFL